MIQTYKKFVQKVFADRPADWAEYKAAKMASTREFMWQRQKYRQQQTPLDFRSRATGAYYIRH